MRLRSGLGVILFMVLGPWTAALADDAFTNMLLKKADKLFQKRTHKGKAEEARQTYEMVLAVAPDNVEARWKIARTLYWIGTHTRNEKKKIAVFESGIRYCQEAIKLDDKCVPCLFWLAASYGGYGEAKGVLHSLALAPYMREVLEKVLKLDARYEWGGADRMLGRMYFKLPSFRGGDNRKAIKHLRTAVKLGPEHLMNARLLAEVLLNEGKKEEAKGLLKEIIDTPERKLLRARYPEMKEEQKKAKKIWQENWEKYW